MRLANGSPCHFSDREDPSMSRFRFRITSLLTLVLISSVGFAALREANDLWASFVLSLTLGALLVSVVLVIHRRETNRAVWIGFAFFGWAYFGLTSIPSVSSRLLTTKALASLYVGLPRLIQGGLRYLDYAANRSIGGSSLAGPVRDSEAENEFQAALTLFEQGKLAEAETRFAKSSRMRWGTTWGERSQYYLAECQFQRGKYVAAHDNFERLQFDYPATEYREKLGDREYAIAQVWLAQSDLQIPAEKKLPWTGHFDGRLPLMDMEGSALEALEHVRQNDPTGPLADDAALQIAEYHATHRDYESAAQYCDQIVSDFPKSPLRARAVILRDASRSLSSSTAMAGTAGTSADFIRIGQSCLTLIMAGLGGSLSRYLFQVRSQG
jgi:outer membrane protein assembly factor BamD (BamD/ComL family)